ncbi:hypothetical protein PIB30_006811 [Stylosanthes scabra]|uniref:Neprosin PEP catalytic domain-containing protein n=1 Tax=Stylosanthes scabra TaxID=79078 RepID=A0ABU6U4P7_9FABA|nr:hypothetical protein [Stylosanthes scabra]
MTLNNNGNDGYTGVNGHVNVYKPKVKKYQMSIAQIGVQNGEFNGINTILTGWQSDSFKKTGCYNMLCPGFVQVDPYLTVGIPIIDFSTYDGPQFEIPFSILQDSESKNWWVIAERKHIGYFPAELFSNLSLANTVGWGGRVSGVMKGKSPPMGSGYFPDGDFKHSCFIRKISYVASDGSTQEPVQEDGLKIVSDSSKCYGLTYFGFVDSLSRFTIQFGGPGGYCAR